MKFCAWIGKVAVIMIISIIIPYHGDSQIIITPSDSTVYTVDSLIKKLVGPGVLISNITFNQGNFSKGVGYYRDTTSMLSLTQGLVLSTGLVNKIPGPNTNIFLSDTVSGSSSDPDLAGLINNSDLFDLASLEFDFTPLSDTLSFNFVFGSEEYAFFSCPGMLFSYNDVFGFFVDGPSPSGGFYNKFNVARLPFTNTSSDVVSILNVTSGGCPQSCSANASFFIPNYSNCTSNPGTFSISHDGFTVKLKANIPVIPCETYHLKLAIADVRDPWFDSFVIIEEGFITTPSRLSIRYQPTSSRFSNLIEGCHPLDLIFTKSQSDTFPETIYYGIYGTADNGTDYTDSLGNPLNGSITFPAFQDTVALRIFASQDSTADSGEDIIIKIFLPCQNTLTDTARGDSVQITIDESFKYDVGLDRWYCPGTIIQLNPNPPVASDSITWSPSSGLSCTQCLSPFSNPDSSILYTAIITDVATGCQSFDSVRVSTGNTADFSSPDTLVCYGSVFNLYLDTIRLKTYGSVGIQWQDHPTIISNSLNQFSISIRSDGNSLYYYVTFTFSGGCTITDSIQVASSPFLTNLNRDTTLCIGSPVTLHWSPFAFDSLVWNSNPHSADWSDSVIKLPLSGPGLYQVSATAFFGLCPYGVFIRARALSTFNTGIEAEYKADDDWIRFKDGDLLSSFPPLSVRFQPMPITNGRRYPWRLYTEAPYSERISTDLIWETEISTLGGYLLVFNERLNDTTLVSCQSFDSLRFQLSAPTMPNIISPNGDGQNDAFAISQFFKGTTISLEVFNRWGRLVFESKDYKDDWTADKLSGGTYFYFIKTSTDNQYQGWIQVIK